MGRSKDPEFLYHYYPLRIDEENKDRDLARVVRAVTSNEVYFSSINGFNDPFDCRPIYVADEKDFFPWVDAVKNDGRFPPEMWEAIKDRWQRGDVTLDQVCSHLKEKVPEIIADKNGIFCLSSDGQNVLMWSHYASSHTGVCLKFIATSTTEFFGEAQEVNYKKDRPIVNIFLKNDQKLAEDTFLTKNIDWKYESEFRIVGPKRKPGIHKFPKHLLKGLIFGSRIASDQEDALKKVVAAVGGIQLYKTDLCQNKYLMDIKEITS
jgi:hypothetical protein